MTSGGEAPDTSTASRPEPEPGPRGRASRWLWWKVFGLLALAGSVWGLAVPLMTGPDEADHATRAAAVARGHLFGVRWSTRHQVDYYTIRVMAPVAYMSAHNVGFCWTLKGEPRRSVVDPSVIPLPEQCPDMTGGQREEAIPTNEFRGQPLYYFLVGLPTLAFRAATGAYLMRVVGALLCAAFLASGLLSLTRLRNPRLAVLGGAAVLTPSVLYFAGTVNPVGLEIAAAFSAWAGMLALVRGVDGPAEVDGRLVTRTALALAALVLTRGLSPGFAVLIVVAAALVAPPGRMRELYERRDVRRWLVGVGVVTALSVAWLVHIRFRFPLPPFPGSGLDFALDQVSWWAREMVGVFGPTTIAPPAALHVLWAVAVAAVVALGWRSSERRHVLIAGVLALGTFVVLVLGEGFQIPPTGVWWQGRYVLPAMVGVVLLVTLAGRGAGVAGPRNGDGPADVGARRPSAASLLGPPLLMLVVGVQVWAFAYAVRHYTVGHDGPANPLDFLFDPDWSPPLLPAWAYVLVLAASLGLLAGLLWRHAGRLDRSAGSALGQPGTVAASDPAVTPAAATVS